MYQKKKIISYVLTVSTAENRSYLSKNIFFKLYCHYYQCFVTGGLLPLLFTTLLQSSHWSRAPLWSRIWLYFNETSIWTLTGPQLQNFLIQPLGCRSAAKLEPLPGRVIGMSLWSLFFSCWVWTCDEPCSAVGRLKTLLHQCFLTNETPHISLVSLLTCPSLSAFCHHKPQGSRPATCQDFWGLWKSAYLVRLE